METTARQLENYYTPKATIGPDNYYVSDEQKAINIQKNSDAGYNPDGTEKFWLRAAKNKTVINFSNNLVLPIITAAVGEGAGRIVFKGAGYFFEPATNIGTNVVYQGFDRATGGIKYIGITERIPLIRFGEHWNAFGTGKELLRYQVVPGATNLSRIDARIIEQNLINQHGLNNLFNVRNSIAPRYWYKYRIK